MLSGNCWKKKSFLAASFFYMCNYISLCLEYIESIKALLGGMVMHTTEKHTLIRERHLHVIWCEQKYFRPLTTYDGDAVTVISPGIWNNEAGPDFLKAHIRIGSQDFYGDVEIHMSEGDWYNHRHHCDSRYDAVIFHLCLWQPRTPRCILTAQGHAIKGACLEERLTIPLQRIMGLIDIDLYPYRQFVGSGRCAKSIFKNMPRRDIFSFFRAAARRRLSEKHSFLYENCEDLSVCVSAGVAMALGYRHNTATFLHLFLSLRRQHLSLSPENILSACMGASGFFEPHYEKKWRGSTYHQKLKTLWDTEIDHTLLPKVSMAKGSIRPLNHPVRRLAYLSFFISEHRNIYQAMMGEWKVSWHTAHTPKGYSALFHNLLECIPTYEDDYWNSHYLFEEKESTAPLPLLGTGLKKEIIVNTFLPLLLHSIHDEEELMSAYSFYSKIPSSKTGKVRYLLHRFFGDSMKGSFFSHADMEQGLYQIHKEYCVHYEASCEGCPFDSFFCSKLL
jgi:hypothetical protein